MKHMYSKNYRLDSVKRYFIMIAILLFSNQLIAQIAGDFRSVSSGNWSSSTTWERFTGTVWQASGVGANNPGQIPDTLRSVFILSGHVVTIDGTSFCNDLNINSGGVLTTSNAELNVYGVWNNNSVFSAGTGSVNLYGANSTLGGSMITDFYNLNANSINGSTMAVDVHVLHNLNSSAGTFKTETFNITVNGLTTIGGLGSIKDAGAGIKQYNGGIEITGGSLVTTTPITIPSTSYLSISLGNLTINAGTGVFTIPNGAATTITGGNITIGNSQTLSLNNTVNMSGGVINGNGALVVNAAFNMSGGTFNGAGSSTINAPNIFTINGGPVVISRNLSASQMNWVAGDFTIGSGAILSTNNFTSSANGTISGNGTLAVSGIGSSFTKTTNAVSTINSVVASSSPATISINGGTLALGGGGTISGSISLTNASTLQFSLGAYTLNSPASFNSTNSNLIVSGATVTANIPLVLDASSNLSLNAGTLTLASASTIGSPVALNGGTLSITSATTFNLPIVNNGSTITTSAPVTINNSSSLNFQAGTFNINAGTGSFSMGASSSFNFLTGTINIAVGQNLNVASSMNMSGGTMTGAGAFNASGAFLMTGGVLSGTGLATISSPGSFTIDGNVSITRSCNVNTTMNWLSGNIAMATGAIMTIGNGALATFSSNGILSGGGGAGGTLAVSGVGTILQKTSNNTTTINTVFNTTSPASLNILEGNLSLGVGGTLSGSHSVSALANLQMNAGTCTFTSPGTLVGNGNLIVSGATSIFNIGIGLSSTASISISSGTMTLGAANTIAPPVTLTGGTLNVNGVTSFQNSLTNTLGTINSTSAVTFTNGSSLQFNSGTMNINAGTGSFSLNSGSTASISTGTITVATGQTFAMAGNATMLSGTINGAGSINISGNFLMNGGTLSGTGTGTLVAPGVMTVDGTVAISRIFNFNSSFNWLNGNINLTSTSPVTFSGGANVTFSSAGTIASSGAGLITFSGAGTTLTKSTSTNSIINVACNITSPAACNINAGILTLSGGGTITGSVTALSGTTLQCTNGTSTISTPSTLTGGGNLIVAGGTLISNIPIGLSSSSNITVSSGTLTLGASSTLAPPITLSGGTMNANSITTFSSALIISGGTMSSTSPVQFSSTSSLTLSAGNLNLNTGTTTLTIPADVNVLMSGGTISVASGQTFSCAGPINMSAGTLNGVGSFNFSGNFNMSGGTLNGNGTTTISSPGLLSITGPVTLSRTLTTYACNWTAGNITLTGSTMTVGNTMNASGSGILSGSGDLVPFKLIKSGTETTTISSQMNVGSGGLVINAGILLLGSNDPVSGNLSILSNAKLRITNGEIISVQSLTLGGNGAVAGSWGSNSTSATNKSDTYFDLGTTGIVQVASNTCVTPVASITTSSNTLTCTNNAITLTGNGVGFYTWENNTSTSPRSITSPGVYNLTITSNGCGTSSTSVTIGQDIAIPNTNLIGGDFTKTCVSNINGAVIGEPSETGYSYSWSPSAGLSNSSISNPIANPSSTTIYTVTKTKINSGCSGTKSITVIVNTVQPIVSAGSSFTQNCIANSNGGSVGEENNINASYVWSPVTGLSSSIISNPFANPSSTITYTVTKTNLENGCSSSASVNIQVDKFPPTNVSIASTSNVLNCLNNSLTLNASAQDNSASSNLVYSWSNGQITNSISVGTASTYTVSTTDPDNGCSASTSINITSDFSLPNINLTASQSTICIGTATSIQASGANLYTWNPGSTTGENLVVNPIATTTYTVSGTNSSNGCTSSSVITIHVNPLPTVDASVSNSTICAGGSATLNATGATSYSWFPTSFTGSSVSVSPLATTTYSVIGTDATTGCSNSSTISVNVNPLPSVGTTATSSSICNGTSTSITANGASSYSWQPISSTNATISISPLITTTYTVTGTNSLGCTNSATRTITVNNCNTSLNIKLFIEGYYRGNGTMAPVRANQGLGTSTINVDQVTIELHNPTPPYALVSNAIAFVKTDGTLTANYTNVIPGSYYIAVKHRNAIKTWSATTITTSTTPATYDFTTSSNKAFGDNMVEVEPGIWAFYSGDVVTDDNIDLLDMALLEFDINEFSFGFIETDINGDGNVDLLDIPVLENNVNNFIFSEHP